MNDILVGQTIDLTYFDLLQDYGTYTPTLSGDTTDPNLGSTGVAEGSWFRRGDWIECFVRFHFSGTGVDPGVGAYSFDPPYFVDSALNEFGLTDGNVIGRGRIRDNDTAANSTTVVVIPWTASDIALRDPGSLSSVGHSTPFTWASDDRISVRFGYLADTSSLPTTPVNSSLDFNTLLRAKQSNELDEYSTYEASLTAATTDPVLGDDGVSYGWYRRSGLWVWGSARFEFGGSGLSAGSGSYRISLPYAPFSTLVSGSGTTANGACLGSGRIRDDSAGANSRLVYVQLLDSTDPRIFFHPPTGNSSVDDTTITWADGDKISVNFAYPIDSSAL